jgi:hypothetical protein
MENKENIFNEVIESEGTVLNSFQCLMNIFISPSKVFQSIEKKPKILLPLIIAPLILLAFYLVSFSSFKETLLTTTEQIYANMDAGFTDEYIKSMVDVSAITQVITQPLVLVGMMFFSALYYWLGVKITKGTITYKTTLSLVAYSGLVSMLSYIVLLIVNLLNGDFTVYPLTSLSTLLPSQMEGGFIYGLLMNMEVFTLWRYILIALGLIHIAKISKAKSYTLVGIAFIFTSLYIGLSLWVTSLVSKL